VLNRAAALLRRVEPVQAGAVLLAIAYTAGYFSDPALPGNDPAQPLGWWVWWDQSQYIASARAMARHDWAPVHHWYPLGYAMLAVPFVRLMPAHPFFFVDLASLLACYGGFLMVARRVGIGTLWAVLAFVLAVAADKAFLLTWFEPWNTSPTAALLWLLLAAIAAHVAAPAVSYPRLGAIGLLAASIPLVRPVEALTAALCLAAVLLHDGLARRIGWRGLLALAAGAALVALPYAVVYLHIYGLRQTDYMRASRQLGFVPGDIGFKAYVLLVDPRAWFGTGQGLLQHAPWMVLGLAGIVPALRAAAPPARWVLGLLALVLLAQAALYICYIDLLPPGLWYYRNVHYFKPLVPGMALLALLWLRQLLYGPRRPAILALAVVLAVLAVRIEPEPATPGDRARLAYFPGRDVGEVYLVPALALRDVRGVLPNIANMRLVRLPDGIRAIALRRLFEGTPTWVPGAAPPGLPPGLPPRLYAERVTIGWPGFLPPYPKSAGLSERPP